MWSIAFLTVSTLVYAQCCEVESWKECLREIQDSPQLSDCFLGENFHQLLVDPNQGNLKEWWLQNGINECRCLAAFEAGNWYLSYVSYESHCPAKLKESGIPDLLNQCSLEEQQEEMVENYEEDPGDGVDSESIPLQENLERKDVAGSIVAGVLGNVSNGVAGAVEAAAGAALLNAIVANVPKIIQGFSGSNSYSNSVPNLTTTITVSSTATSTTTAGSTPAPGDCATTCALAVYNSVESPSQGAVLKSICSAQETFSNCLGQCGLGNLSPQIQTLCATANARRDRLDRRSSGDSLVSGRLFFCFWATFSAILLLLNSV